MRKWIVFTVLALAGAAADLWSKDVVLRKVLLNQEMAVVDGFFYFGHLYNEGIVFGKFQNLKSVWLIVSIVAVPVIVAIFASMKDPRWLLTVSLGLILGGTLGNLYDRAKFGKVRDFIKFTYKAGKVEHPWPLFNLADAYICAGVLLLSAEMVFFDEKKRKKLRDEKAAKAAAAAAAVAASAPTAPMPVDPEAPTVHDGVKPKPCVSCGMPVDPSSTACAKCGAPKAHA